MGVPNALRWRLRQIQREPSSRRNPEISRIELPAPRKGPRCRGIAKSPWTRLIYSPSPATNDLGGYAVLDQPLQRRRLHHFAGARLAGILGAAGHDHLELRRDDIEQFRDVLADPVLEATAARAGLIRYIDDGFFARQMRRQRAAIDLPPARRDLLASRAVVLRRGVSRRERLLHILQAPAALLGIEQLGTAAKAGGLALA